MSSPWAAPGSSSESSSGRSPSEADGTGRTPGPWSADAGAWGESAGAPRSPDGTTPDPASHGPRAARSRELAVRSPLFPLRPLSLGEMLGAGTRIYRERPRTVFGVAAIVLGVTYALSTVLSGTSMLPLASGLGALTGLDEDVPTSAASFDAQTLIPLVLGSLAGGLLSFIGTQLVTVAVTRVAIGEATGTSVDTSQVWTLLRRRALAAIGLGLLISTLLALAFAVPMAVVVLLALAGLDTISTMLIAAVLLLAAAVAALWFWARTLLTVPALVTEEIGPIAAIRRSFDLTRGRRLWRVLGIGLLLTLMVGVATEVLQGALSMITTVLYTIVLAASNGQQVTLAMEIMLVMTMASAYLCSVVTLPFLASSTAALYADARMRHEGWDVELGRLARAARSGR